MIQNNQRITKNEEKKIFYLFTFLFFSLFFSYVHPIILFDADDWINTSMARPPYPSFQEWNPTKVFPECLESLVGTIAAFVVSPIVGDYLQSLTISTALIVSLFICIYLWLTQNYIEQRFNISTSTGFLIILLFAIFHFLILFTKESNNEYLWYSHDYNCYYHYTISNLLCACLVIWSLNNLKYHYENSFRNGLLLLALYLALCSNLYSTVIIIAYIGSVLLVELFSRKKEKKWFILYIKQHYIYLIIIFLWLVIQLIEVNGNRAQSYSYLGAPLIRFSIITFKVFLTKQYNTFFIIISLLFIFIAGIHSIINNKKIKIDKQQLYLFVALFLSIIYLILLCSRVSIAYIQLSDVIFSYSVFYLLITINSIAYLCNHIRKLLLFFPLLIFVCFFTMNQSGKNFIDVQDEFYPNPQKCVEIDRNMINLICQAEEQGKDSVCIMVPFYNDDDNWPLSYEFSEWVGTTLYKHGITRHKLVTTFKSFETKQ